MMHIICLQDSEQRRKEIAKSRLGSSVTTDQRAKSRIRYRLSFATWWYLLFLAPRSWKRKHNAVSAFCSPYYGSARRDELQMVGGSNDIGIMTAGSKPHESSLNGCRPATSNVLDGNPVLFKNSTSSSVDENIKRARSTPCYLSLSPQEMSKLTNYFCDKSKGLQPYDFHDMFRLQQALYKRAQTQKEQKLAVEQDVLNNDTDTILIQKLLHRALDELTLVETNKSTESQDRISTCSIPTSLSPKGRKKLHATQRHLKLLCTIAILSLVQLDQNLKRAMELLDQLESSVYSLEIDDDKEKRRKNTTINQKLTALPTFQILPGYACYMALVTGWTKQLQQTTASPTVARQCAEKAQQVLYKMIARALSSTNFLLTRQSFNVVLNAWAELGCGSEARALLNEMNELPSNIGAESEEHEIAKKSESSSSTTNSQPSQLLSSLRPDLFSYNTVLKAYAKEQTILRSYRNKLGIQRHQRRNRNEDEAPPSPCYLAEQLLKQIEEGRTVTHGGMPLFPDRISYTSVIDAFAASNERDAAFKAEALLNRMEQLYRETGNESIKPDTIAYNNVLNAFSKYSEQQTGQSVSMNKDSSIDNLGERCEKLLQRMERLYIEGENPDVRPDTYSYNSVINTWANTAHCDSARRALDLLDEMERLSLSGEERVTPNTISYNTVIKAWGRNADATAPQLVDDLLHEMEERYESGDVSCKPDRFTYNSVMFSWANSADVRAAGKVEELLNRMISLYKQNGDISVKPDVTSYNILLNCWAKTRAYGASELACELLGRMIHLSNIGDPDAVSPDTRSYVAVMNCISKSSDPGKAQKALDVLNSLESSFRNGNSAAIPNVFAYSIVLNACAFTTGDEIERKQAMDIAIETLSRVSKSRTAKPNHVIYGSFLKACAMLMPMEDPRKRQMITDAFSKCCRDGQVGSNVLEQLKFAAPPDLYDSLVGHYIVNGQIGLQTIPSSWRCSVRENKFHSPKRKQS